MRFGRKWRRLDNIRLRGPLRDPYLSHFDIERILGSLFYGRTDFDDAVATLATVFHRVRKSFEYLGMPPGAAPLTAVVAGNHYSLIGALKTGQASGNLDLGPFSLRTDRLRGRALVCLLGAALERLEGVELRWLADAVPGMTPTTRKPEYDALVARVRDSLGAAKPPTLVDVAGVVLKLPASPMIFVRDGDAGAWEPLPADSRGRGGRSLTSELIKKFKKARRKSGGRLEGVLIKVLGDASRHSPADAPIVTPTHRKDAKAAGLQAILLDSRYGVIRPPAPGEEKYCEAMPVFAA